jgi:hypothetical protein
VYLRLLPRMQSLREVFSGYFPYMQYIASEKGFLWRLLQGVFLGRPALDIQLIHATATLAHNKSLSEQTDISAAFAAAADLDSRGEGTHGKGFQDLDIDHLKAGSRGGTQTAFNANCFRPPESSGTVKNRKGVSNRAGPSLMLPSSSDSGSGLHPSGPHSSLDFSVVYDLPQNGFSVQTSFWETLRLARTDGADEEAWVDPATSPAGDCLQGAFSREGETGDSHREGSTSRLPLTRRVNRRQRSLSTMMLYSMLVTAALSLLLASLASAVFLSSLVPVRWVRHVGQLSGSAGRLQTGTFLTSTLSEEMPPMRGNHSRSSNHTHPVADSPGTAANHRPEAVSIADPISTPGKGVQQGSATTAAKSMTSVGSP